MHVHLRIFVSVCLDVQLLPWEKLWSGIRHKRETYHREFHLLPCISLVQCLCHLQLTVNWSALQAIAKVQSIWLLLLQVTLSHRHILVFRLNRSHILYVGPNEGKFHSCCLNQLHSQRSKGRLCFRYTHVGLCMERNYVGRNIYILVPKHAS